MIMRLLHVVDSLERGGLERVVTDLAIEQARLGHEVAVFSLLETGGLADELRAAGIEVLVGGKSRSVDLGLLRRLRGVIKARRIELVHAHNFVPNYHAAAALLGLWRKPTLVSTCHDMGTRLSNRRLLQYYRWSLKHTAGLAMVGAQVHERFVRDGLVPEAKATTVFNGIPVQRFVCNAERRAVARDRLGLGQDALVVGAVGRLVALKNHRLLIEQMPALLQDWPQLRLVILGGGPLEDELRALALQLGVQDQVLLAGQRSDVADLTPAFDVFAMPSLTEGLSIALLEAAATGLALVATDVGGNPEIVRDGQTGLLVPVDDGPALQQALRRCLLDPALRQTLGTQAQQFVTQTASLAKMAEVYADFYRRAQGR
jgi:glycosyltransferase involved in cell wall biosynthesis